MKRAVLLSPILALALWAGVASAQTTVIQTENVRFDYAQVLRVTPVYQTLTASRVEQQCEPGRGNDSSRFSRAMGAMRGAVKGALRRNSENEAAAQNCREITVEREFKRPIAYDVDYIYKGSKFRSRLPEDPGNRLRIRVSVMPVVAGATDR